MRKTKVIAIANQKGGVGKTTTSINLSACLATLGKDVLLIDADQQGNTTSGLGIEKNALDETLYNVMLGEKSIKDIILETCAERLELAPSNMNLSGIEVELLNFESREFVLKRQIDLIKEYYDYIFIDCPPALNTITINSLASADSVIVPMQCEYYALEGLQQLLHTISIVRKGLNPKLDIEGVVLTMHDSRINLSSQVVEEVKNSLGDKVYKTIIPRNVSLSEAPSHGLPITLYAKKSKGCIAYMELAEEIIAAN